MTVKELNKAKDKFYQARARAQRRGISKCFREYPSIYDYVPHRLQGAIINPRIKNT